MSQPIGPDFHYHLRQATQPSLSPDASRVVYTVERFEQDSRKALTDLHIVATDARSEPKRLTDDGISSSPAWSPDGSTIAFLRLNESEEKQLWLMDPDGSDQRRLTDRARGVDAFSWSPDSSRIAYRADVDETGGDGRPGAPRVARRIRYRQDGRGWRGDAFFQLFVVDVGTGGSFQLTFGDADVGSPAWSPDGARIAFISDRSPFRDTTSRTEVYIAPADGGEADRWSGGLYMVGSIGWSPDGARMAVTGAEQPEQVGGYGLVTQCWVYAVEPGMYPARLTDDSLRPQAASSGHPVDAEYPKIAWAPDGTIYFLADARGRSYICRTGASGGAVERITGGDAQITAWDVDPGAEIAVVAQNFPGGAGDLFSISLSTGSRSRLTALNDAYFEEHPAPTLEHFSVERDDCEIECRLWLPPDFDAARRYPLLLDVHGGPHSAFYDAFYPVHQIGATNGYVVLAPNPRGSSTYGLEFATAVHGDWGGGDYLDIMAALTEALKLPYIDENRVVLHGSSYGGYMASWAVGHTDRFRAAVIAAPVTNLPSFYGTSDIGVNFSEVQFRGRRSDNLSWYIRHSPLTYASNVSTPVLLIHGESDARVPIEQAEQYFVALKRAGKVAEFVRLPGTSHGIFRAADPATRREYFEHMLAWFERWLRDDRVTVNGAGSRRRKSRASG